jgi:hypothetical protein
MPICVPAESTRMLASNDTEIFDLAKIARVLAAQDLPSIRRYWSSVVWQYMNSASDHPDSEQRTSLLYEACRALAEDHTRLSASTIRSVTPLVPWPECRDPQQILTVADGSHWVRRFIELERQDQRTIENEFPGGEPISNDFTRAA